MRNEKTALQKASQEAVKKDAQKNVRTPNVSASVRKLLKRRTVV